jgi:hypothetical protein
LAFDAGLGTMNLFAGDLVKDSLKPVDGVLEVRRPEVATSALDTLKLKITDTTGGLQDLSVAEGLLDLRLNL